MSVVFISPKQTQKTFFISIVALLVLFLAVVSFLVFFSQPTEVSKDVVFKKTKVNIDLSILDSDQFKKLVPFEEMPLQFSYEALNKDNKEVTGIIAAPTQEDAIELLKEQGFTVGSIKEVEVGREDPFEPYY